MTTANDANLFDAIAYKIPSDQPKLSVSECAALLEVLDLAFQARRFNLGGFMLECQYMLAEMLHE